MASNFYLLRPENLPASRTYLGCEEDLYRILENVSKLTQEDNVTSILEMVRNSLTSFNKLAEVTSIVEDDPNESFENKANDQAFNIVRVDGDPIYIITYSSLRSFAGMLEEFDSSGVNLSDVEWKNLVLAYICLFNILKGDILKCNSIQISKSIFNKKNVQTNRDGMRRWVSGHYVFMSIVQGLVIALNCFSEDFKMGNYEAARLALDNATILMQGSESALRFTGDFSRVAYEQVVRPSLLPPVAPPGMSGLHWRDHEYLIKNVFRGLRPIFSKPPPEIRIQANNFVNTLKSTYDAHKCVCSLFVGNEESSLLSKKSASKMLENYKHNRVQRLIKMERSYMHDTAS